LKVSPPSISSFYDFCAVHEVATVEGQAIVLPYVTVMEPEASPVDVNAPETSSVEAGEDAEDVKAPSPPTAVFSAHVAASSPGQGGGNET